MKLRQLHYKVMILRDRALAKNLEKTDKNHKRRNVTDHIVRLSIAVLVCVFNTKKNSNWQDDSVLFWMKLN